MANNLNQNEISVLHIILSTETGGMENVIYNLAIGHNNSRVKLNVLCLEKIGGLSNELEKLGIQKQLAGKMVPGISLIYPAGLIKLIKQSGCDVVHTHSGCWFKVAMACAHLPHVKLVYTDHGRMFPESRLMVVMDKIAARFTHKVVAVGAALKSYLISNVKLPAEKVIQINNCIDSNRYLPAANNEDIRKELGYDVDDVVIVVVARLAPVKNHRLLIDAFRELSARFPKARLMIVGDGSLRNELENMTAEYQLEGAVNFLGDRNDVPRLLQAADIATLSSFSEGVSLTILEAMSTGLPVVATAVGGTPTIITDGENGYLVKSNDIESYSECLGKLLESSDDRARMGQNARKHILANWSLSRMTKEYEELYLELTNNSK